MIKFPCVSLEDQIENYSRSHQNLDLGDNWEDELKREFAKERRKIRDALPKLEEIIYLDYPHEELVFTQAFLNATSSEEIQAIINMGTEWAKN